MHFLSKVSRSSEDSPVDRGANVGVEWNDVRVIDKCPDSTEDFWGTDDYEMHSISLVTAGRVKLTTSGEVIIIVHQYEFHGKNKIFILHFKSNTTRIQQMMCLLRSVVVNT